MRPFICRQGDGLEDGGGWKDGGGGLVGGGGDASAFSVTLVSMQRLWLIIGRLSDWAFVFGRAIGVTKAGGVEVILWVGFNEGEVGFDKVCLRDGGPR